MHDSRIACLASASFFEILAPQRPPPAKLPATIKGIGIPGIIYRAMGIPTKMFTVMFALGRLPGWLAHWKEMINSPHFKINRPRQIYMGQNKKKL